MPENHDHAEASEAVRLHRFIAQCGLTSRRKAEEWIAEGRVSVNGEVVTTLGVKVIPGVDNVEVDGNPVGMPDYVTYLFYKPRGVVTTLQDTHGRPTVAKFLPPGGPAVKPVGRLDQDTDGLLLMTNEGELAFRLSHPRYSIEKEYKAVVSGIPDEKNLEDLRKGVFIDGRRTAPAQIEMVSQSKKDNTATLQITLHEGRKRQIRLMCQTVGHPVRSLRRVRLAFLTLTKLEPGQMRLLSKVETSRLRQMVGLE